MPIKIDVRECDDWIAVYKDGKKVWENHSCPLAEGLHALDIEFAREWMKVDDLGNGPGGRDPFPDEI